MAEINNLLSQTTSGGGIWGTIVGNVINQADLISYLSINYYPLLSNPANYLTQKDVLEYINLALFPLTGTVGTIYIANNQDTTGIPVYYIWNGTNYVTTTQPVTGITGSGITNRVTKWITPTTLGNSGMYDDGLRIGIGTSIPVSTLSLTDTQNLAFRGITMSMHHSSRSGSLINFRKSRGTESLPLSVQSGDYTGLYFMYNHDGTTYRANGSFGYYVGGAVATDSVEGEWFWASHLNHDVDPYFSGNVKMVLKSSGNLGVGNTNPTQKFHVTGNARITGSYLDSTNNPGTLDQVLKSTVTGTQWSTLPSGTTQNLQQVLNVGNTATGAMGSIALNPATGNFNFGSNLGIDSSYVFCQYNQAGFTNTQGNKSTEIGASAGSFYLIQMDSSGLWDTNIGAQEPIVSSAIYFPAPTVTGAYNLPIIINGQVANANGEITLPSSTTSVIGTSPINVSGSASPGATEYNVSIVNAVADGATKGAASFSASDFNSLTGNISIDYINGQSANISTKGFLTSIDWNTFNTKETSIIATTSADYYRGDKTFATLNKAAVGLANIDNTSDVNKPVSIAQQNALDLKENTANKTDLMTGNTTSSIKFLSAKGIFDYIVSLAYATTTYVTSALATFKTTNFLDATSSIQTQLNSKIQTGTTAGGDLSGTYPNPAVLNSAVLTKLLTGLNVTGSSLLNTDTLLQAFGKLQNQINGILGGAIYQGVYNVTTNTPTLVDGVGTKGYYYVVNGIGTGSFTRNFGSGNIEFADGDWAIYNGTIWQKVDNTDAVTSVNGFLGAVNLTSANISEVTNLYFTTSRVLTVALTGYVSGAGTITATDTILQAIQKLSGNIAALTTANVPDSLNKRYVTDAQLAVIGNTSGINTGDNATNTQYSGLATSKENTVNKTDIMTGNTTSSTLFLSAKGVFDYVVSLGYATTAYVTSQLSSFKTANFLDATSSIQTQINSKVNQLPTTTDKNIVRFNGVTGAQQNSVVTIDDAGGIIVPGETSPTYTAKSLKYDNTINQWIAYDNDSQTSLNIGYETWFICLNNTAAVIPNGSVVYISGSSGGIPTIALAKGDSITTTVGVGITTQNIPISGTGKVTQSGLVNGLNTSGLTGGAVYVSGTVAGGLTNTLPSTPFFRMRVGFVGVVSATVGTILVTPSTAAIDDKQFDMFYYAGKNINLNDDYLGTVSTCGGQGNNNGAGTVVSGNTRIGAQGVQTCGTGVSASTGGGSIIGDGNGGSFYLGSGTLSYERRIFIPILSTSLERFTIFEGFQNSANFINAPTAVFFLYDEGGTYGAGANPASPNWKCVTANGGARTFTTTSIAVPVATYVKLRIEINAAGTSVTYFIDNVLVATHTTNIPASTIALHQRNFINKSVGTTARTVDADYIAIKQILTTAR